MRAKYRIVVLGNLDPHDWSKSECFAPVMSQMELNLMMSLACQLKTEPKQGDFIQAFCQSTLPAHEQYICKPPLGCPVTPPNTYLRLIKTLYGLKRSPRHWYEKSKKVLASIGLHPSPNVPCLYSGTIIPGSAPLYLGMYVDDFIYFSTDPKVEKKFEVALNLLLNVEFTGPPQYFLGLKVKCKKEDNHLSIFLSQEAAATELVDRAGLSDISAKINKTPYRTGYPVDKISAMPNLPLSVREKIEDDLRSYVGSLNWLGTCTRPDLSTITNMLSRYLHKATPSHISAAKYAIKYLKGTLSYGIQFTSKHNISLEAFVKLPTDPSKVLTFTDANWGPQDASVPKSTDAPTYLDLFKSRSISGYLIWLGGPLFWISKRQSITAHSTAEAEVYATNECTKRLTHLQNILRDLNITNILTSLPINIYNDNEAAVKWSRNQTTKGLRHIQMRENAIRE